MYIHITCVIYMYIHFTCVIYMYIHYTWKSYKQNIRTYTYILDKIVEKRGSNYLFTDLRHNTFFST